MTTNAQKARHSILATGHLHWKRAVRLLMHLMRSLLRKAKFVVVPGCG
jgi:hypothetical protein